VTSSSFLSAYERIVIAGYAEELKRELRLFSIKKFEKGLKKQ